MSRKISEANRRRRSAVAPWGRMPRTMRAARWAENVPATPPGTRSRRSPCRRLFQWMDILIVPVAVGIGLYLLEQSQRRREENEQRRREEERERAAALQEYLNQMSEDLKTQRFIRAEPSDEVGVAARARTLSILSILDPVRKGRVVKFLHEAGPVRSERPIIELVDADSMRLSCEIKLFLRLIWLAPICAKQT
jgi:hypothetical protein